MELSVILRDPRKFLGYSQDKEDFFLLNMCCEQSAGLGGRLMTTSPCLYPKLVWSKTGDTWAWVKIRHANWSLILLEYVKPYQPQASFTCSKTCCFLVVYFLILAKLFPDTVITDLSQKLNYQARHTIHLKIQFFFFFFCLYCKLLWRL